MRSRTRTLFDAVDGRDVGGALSEYSGKALAK
jgi:hypothetical protein